MCLQQQSMKLSIAPFKLLCLQDLLLERSSNTLKSIAELDAKELQRHRQNSLLWQVGALCVMAAY